MESKTLYSLCVLTATLLGLFAAGHVFSVTNTIFVQAETFIAYIFLPSYALLAYSLFAKRKLLAATSTALIFCHLWWVIPELHSATSLPAEVDNAPRVTIFSQNILFDNKLPTQIGDNIAKQNTDFVFLQEFSYKNLETLRSLDVFKKYPYKLMEPAGGPEGIALWSKYPLSETEVLHLPSPQLRAVANVNGQRLVLWSIHTQAPVGGQRQVNFWKDDLTNLRTRLNRETDNVVVGGDFNATWTHKPFRSLLHNGWREVHVDRGRGYAHTWPVDRTPWDRTGGLIRIDHFLTSKNVRAVRIEEDPGYSSDHRSIITEVALLKSVP